MYSIIFIGVMLCDQIFLRLIVMFSSLLLSKGKEEKWKEHRRKRKKLGLSSFFKMGNVRKKKKNNIDFPHRCGTKRKKRIYEN